MLGAPQWVSVLFFAPLALAMYADALEVLFRKTARWRQLSLNDSKRRNAMLALLKAVIYSTVLGLSLPPLAQLAKTWGTATWVQDNVPLFTCVMVEAGLIAAYYLFELAFKPVVSQAAALPLRLHV